MIILDERLRASPKDITATINKSMYKYLDIEECGDSSEEETDDSVPYIPIKRTSSKFIKRSKQIIE